ncbi:MAG: helix-turn-helix domain-containing protein [Thermoanaerobaculia bacterium]|nr:helix-turn-helix domain-containing protein [Thermoanaerobaculia bacterium]
MCLIDTKQAAQRLGVSPRTVENWRVRGDGPPFLRLSRTKGVRYRLEDLERFVAERVAHSTSEEARS